MFDSRLFRIQFFWPIDDSFWCDYVSNGGETTAEYTYSADGRYYAEGHFSLNNPNEKKEFDAKKHRAPTANKTVTTTSQSGSSAGTSSTSASSTSNNEPGLLFKGPYTRNCSDVPMMIAISVYEDRLFDGLCSYSYKSTNSRGERIYSGSCLSNSFSKWYVNTSNQNIRLEQTVTSQWGSSTVTCAVSKGHDFDQRATFGGNNGGGGYAPASSSSSSNSGTTTNPVQPHQVTTTCTSCHGSGKCPTCNGKHWYYGIGGTKITCPNCTPNGACPSCGGSGKKTTTKYY